MYGKHGKPEAGFPLFPHTLEIPPGFPHSHGFDDDYHSIKDRQSPPQTRNQSHSHRKGLVNHVPGPKRKGCPGTLTPLRSFGPLLLGLAFLVQSEKSERRITLGPLRGTWVYGTREKRIKCYNQTSIILTSDYRMSILNIGFFRKGTT